jgi:hypothetical protein
MSCAKSDFPFQATNIIDYRGDHKDRRHDRHRDRPGGTKQKMGVYKQGRDSGPGRAEQHKIPRQAAVTKTIQRTGRKITKVDIETSCHCAVLVVRYSKEGAGEYLDSRFRPYL